MTEFEKKVNSVFSGVEEYSENAKTGRVTFVIQNADFTAEDLFAISDLLGSGTVNIESSTRNEGYCSTCSYEYGVMEITFSGVKF